MTLVTSELLLNYRIKLNCQPKTCSLSSPAVNGLEGAQLCKRGDVKGKKRARAGGKRQQTARKKSKVVQDGRKRERERESPNFRLRRNPRFVKSALSGNGWGRRARKRAIFLATTFCYIFAQVLSTNHPVGRSNRSRMKKGLTSRWANKLEWMKLRASTCAGKGREGGRCSARDKMQQRPLCYAPLHRAGKERNKFVSSPLLVLPPSLGRVPVLPIPE